MKSQSLDKIKDLIINYIRKLYLIPPSPFEQEQSLTKRFKNLLILYRKNKYYLRVDFAFILDILTFLYFFLNIHKNSQI